MNEGGFDPQKFEDFLGKLKGSQNNWKFGATIALVILVILFLKSTIYTIQPEEVGVVQRFGKFVQTTDPGLHFKLPGGIDKVTKVRTQFVFKQEFGYQTRQAGIRTEYAQNSSQLTEESLMLTGDLNIADVEWSVQFRIYDPAKFLFEIRDPVGTLRYASEAAMRLIVGDRSVDEVLTFGREEINVEVQAKLQEYMDGYKTGIKIVTVQLQDVNPPDAVKESFDDVNKAKQEKETVINQAREAYNKVIPQARGQAEKEISSAEGYATKRINEADGDAKRFREVYKAYSLSPSVIKRRLYIETMADVLKKAKDVYVIDENLKNVMPFLQMMGTPAGQK